MLVSYSVVKTTFPYKQKGVKVVYYKNNMRVYSWISDEKDR